MPPRFKAWVRVFACLGLATWAALAHAEAPGPAIPAALAIPAVASRAQAFVPDGFAFVREVVGDLGGPYPGVAQVYENPVGRRALLLGMRRPDGFEATGWGFILPCRTCGGDLSGDRNLELRIRGHAVVVIDRSASDADGTTTRAELELRRDSATLKWRLAVLTQLTAFTREGRAEQSITDYERGETRDSVGRYDGETFFAEKVENATIAAPVLTLDTLTLY